MYKVIPALAEKIFFVHFRNCRGTLTDFQETFHDNGDIKMAEIMKLYKQCGVNVPIRVDHVPTLLGEQTINQGYDALGRLYAIGYLKGMIEGVSSKKAKRVDLVMFMGQSNMAGRGDASISTVVPEGHGYEFRAISDPTKLYPVEEPFGVDENNAFSDVYETTKTGSLVSSFIEEYYQQREVPIVGVSCSKGGTGLDFWAPDGAAIEDAIERHDAARTWLEENGYIIENDFMVWCQGETDGGRGMDAETYATGLTDIIEKMISEAGIDFCAVIRIGHARDNADRHIQIIEAQTELCETYDKAVLVSTKFAGFGAEYMKDEYHYTQPAYNEVGKEAGMNTAYYIMNGKKPSMYDPQYDNN